MSSLSFTLLYLCFTYLVVAIVWIITTPLKRLVAFSLPLSRILQVALNSMHLVSGLFFPLYLPYDIPIRSLGLTILTVGAVLAVWAKITMKSNWGFPGTHTISIQKYLVTEGPFEYTRNPIYLGIILMCFGMAIALKSAFIFLIFILYYYFQNKVQSEEKALVKHFGKDYIEYCSEVPRFI